jgi:hypothetical protein
MDDLDEQPDFNDLCDEPLHVRVHGPAVLLTGPDGIALAMTQAAAIESARRLLNAAQDLGAAAGLTADTTSLLGPAGDPAEGKR